MKGLSIVIPNYNGKHLFEKYFAQNLEVFKTLTIPFEIIVVDDDSKDDSLVYLNENYLNQIQIIAKKINSGFSNTCNQGIKAAQYDLVFLLNTDVLLTPNYFDRLFKYFEDENTFGVMGRIIGMNDDIIQDAARLPKLFGRKIKAFNSFYIDDKNFLTPTIFLAGSSALINTKKLKTIDGFNELFNPFYGEDFELCLRAWRMGWKCYYDHYSICRHECSGTTKDLKKKRWVKFIYFRNKYFAHFLHLNQLDLLIWNVQVFIFDFIVSVFTLKIYKVKAYLNFISTLKSLKASKNEFASLMNKNSATYSIKDVIKKIHSLINNKVIKKI